MPSSKRVGIIQSNYVPWKGYFDFIASVDEFIVFDDVQYTRRDWRNRNLVKTKDGLKWLTIPVDVKGKYFQTIRETAIADAAWPEQHLAMLRHAYGRAAHFRAEWEWIEPLLHSCAGIESLTAVNVRIIEAVCRRLQIATPIRQSSEFELVEGKNERLIALCKQTGATEYLSGPAARDYVDPALWEAANVRVLYKSYEGYPEYAQLHPPFEHGVSILDLLFNTGADAARYVRSAVAVTS